jgi:hypothetical protein
MALFWIVDRATRSERYLEGPLCCFLLVLFGGFIARVVCRAARLGPRPPPTGSRRRIRWSGRILRHGCRAPLVPGSGPRGPAQAAARTRDSQPALTGDTIPVPRLGP